MSAIQAIEKSTVSYSDILTQAELAFRTSEETYCGPMDFILQTENPAYASFLKIDTSQALLTIEPLVTD